MARKRRVRYDRIVLCALVAILLIVAIVAGIRFILKDDTNKNDADPIPSVISSGDTKIEVNDYKVYEDKNSDLGFNFVVANLKFSNENGINYDLANLKTSEGTSLNDVTEYQKVMEVQNYNYASLNTVTSISSTDKEYTAKVFIPYKENATSIIVTDAVTNSSLYMDVTSHKGDIDTLKKEDNSQEIVTSNFDISLANNYVASEMYHNGQYYDSSMLNVYVFEMKVNSASNNAKITNATFKQSSTGETWNALDSSYTTAISGKTIENILDKTLSVGDTYALFFEVYGNPNENTKYEGTITFEFSDNSTKVIDTKLN